MTRAVTTHVQQLSFLIVLFQRVSGFALVSQSRSSLAYGSALDGLGPDVIPLGIDTSGSRNEHANCYISIGNVNGFDRSILDSPTMCLDLAIFENSNSTSFLSTQFPDGVVSAMDGPQPKLFSLNYKSSSTSKPNLVEIVTLPNGTFPAVMTADREKVKGGVYVALHNTTGLSLWNDLSKTLNNNVIATWQYLQHLTHPKTEMPSDNHIESHSPIVYKYDILDGKEAWQTQFDTYQGKTLITGMETVLSRNLLVVAGTTNGYGTSTGEEEGSGEFWDGFLTLVDLETGNIEDYNHGTYKAHSTRIQSQWNKNDFVLGLCMSDDKAFVVGSTTGKIEGKQAGGGFVMKIDVDTLDVIWKKQIFSFIGEGIEATHCDVQGNNLFVGGSIPPGGQIHYTEAQSTTNTVDIFVALFDAYDGEMRFTRQIDSHRHDQLVRIEIHTASGDAYLTANAWDFTQGTTNLYVLSIDEQGEHAWQSLASGEDPITGRVPTKPTENDHNNVLEPSPIIPVDNQTLSVDEDNRGAIAVAIAVPVIILFGLLAYSFCGKNNEKEPTDETIEDALNVENHSSDNKIM
jgi:outer membrane protein assembly factor BamB